MPFFGHITGPEAPIAPPFLGAGNTKFEAIYKALPEYFLRQMSVFFDQLVNGNPEKVIMSFNLKRHVFACGHAFTQDACQQIIMSLFGSHCVHLQRKEFCTLVYIVNAGLQHVYSTGKVTFDCLNEIH